jgi:hypothetical protein
MVNANGYVFVGKADLSAAGERNKTRVSREAAKGAKKGFKAF